VYGSKGGSGIVIVRYVAGGACDPYEVWRQGVSNRRYAVMAATNLIVGFTNLVTNIWGVAPENVYTDTVGTAGQKFYRVKVGEPGNGSP
jgi:hypothetical protein